MKLELGGSGANGAYVRGDGWLNMDVASSADIRHDANLAPWPLADDSVEAVYSSHCLEHLDGPFLAFAEICRVCRIGSPVEIRVPHPASHLAMVHGHKHVYGPLAAINIETYFPADFWRKRKRLRLERIEYAPSLLLEEAKRELPFLFGLSDETIQRWIPGTCHECRFFYAVTANEFYSDE